MVQPSAQPASRYRRRILGLGALATGCLYVIGAPIYADRIETDLEVRVPAELAAAGFTGLTASFSGQDGTLTCEEPLDDPEGAKAAAYDVKGVRTIEIDRSCRVNTSSSLGDDDSGGIDESTDEGSDASADSTTTSVPSDTSPLSDDTEESSDADLATVADVVAANPDLAFLSVLLADTDIGRSERPITLFAPSNAAFDAVPSDLLSRLQNDPELLGIVLDHHVVDGILTSEELTDGELVADDGSVLVVVVGDDITVGGGTVIEPDIIASNGVVHVVDTVLLSADVIADPVVERAAVAATYDGEVILLTGVAASEVERQLLVESAVEAVGVEQVVDEMTVDPDTGLDAAAAARLIELVRAMPANLRSGEAGFDGTEFYATGVVRSDAGRVAYVAAAAGVDVEAQLSDPPPATEADATDLEEQLNAFVSENPILFEPSSELLVPGALAVIDRIAADALRFDGITITVEGHTDSDGVPIENLQLSQDRAEVVRAALIERGLAADSVTAVGFGSDVPVLVGGVEDKGASRRVEFRVVAAP